MGTKISGIFTVRNAFGVGYPFVESILSVLPVTDEFLIGDRYSTDGTSEVFERLQRVWSKIKILHFEEKKGKHCEHITLVLNNLVKEARGDWILEIQADEGYHEKDLFKFRKVVETAPDTKVFTQEGLTISSFRIAHKGLLLRIMRFFKNTGEVSLTEAGAGISGKITPEKRLDFPLYHFYNSFPFEAWKRTSRHHLQIATEDKTRAEWYERLKRNKAYEKDTSYYSEGPVLDFIPSIFKGLAELRSYKVREELFDRRWLGENTGLAY